MNLHKSPSLNINQMFFFFVTDDFNEPCELYIFYRYFYIDSKPSAFIYVLNSPITETNGTLICFRLDSG